MRAKRKLITILEWMGATLDVVDRPTVHFDSGHQLLYLFVPAGVIPTTYQQLKHKRKRIQPPPQKKKNGGRNSRTSDGEW